MLTKLKAVGLVVMVAVMASAVGLPTASAQTLEGEFGAASGTVTATSTTDLFTAGSGEIKCVHTGYEATFTSPATTLSVVPKYYKCSAFGFASTDVKNSGCALEFSLNNEHGSGVPITESKVSVELNCAQNAHVVVTPTYPLVGVSLCTITFQTQNISGDIDLTLDIASTPDDLVVGPDAVGGLVGGIKYSVTTSHVGCPAVGSYANGTYHVPQITVRAFSDAAHTVSAGLQLVTR